MVQRDPSSLAGWEGLFRSQYHLGHNHEVIAIADRIPALTALSSEAEVALFTKATVLNSLEHYEAALAVLDRLMDVADQSPRFWLFKAGVLVNLRQYEEALEAARHAVGRAPNDAHI